MPNITRMTVKRDWQGGCHFCGATTCDCPQVPRAALYDPELIPGFFEVDRLAEPEPYQCMACEARCNKLYDLMFDHDGAGLSLFLVCEACCRKVMEVLKLA